MEALTVEEVAKRCQVPQQVHFELQVFALRQYYAPPVATQLYAVHILAIPTSRLFDYNTSASCASLGLNFLNIFQVEMVYKIISHMAANDRAVFAEGDCGTPRSATVYSGECGVDDLYDD